MTAINEEARKTITRLLHFALLRIRDAGWRGDAPLCAIEADHVHNLPTLLDSGKTELLAFYWNTERPLYIEKLQSHVNRNGANLDVWIFEEIWSSLEKHVASSTE